MALSIPIFHVSWPRNPFVILLSVVIVAVALLIPLSYQLGKKGVEELASQGTYVASKGMKMFLILGPIFFWSLLISFVVEGTKLALTDWVAFLSLGFLSLIICISVWMLRLQLKEASFTYRETREREIFYKDVSSMQWLVSGRGIRFLIVHYGRGEKLRISNYVQGLDDFAKKLDMRCSDVRGGFIERLEAAFFCDLLENRGRLDFRDFSFC